jgi:hypothetical protein
MKTISEIRVRQSKAKESLESPGTGRSKKDFPWRLCRELGFASILISNFMAQEV